MRPSIEKILLAWNNWVARYSLIIVCLVPLLAVWILFYTANNLGMNTDTTDMLSSELSWRQLDSEYETLFPHSSGNLILVIEAETPDEAMDSALTLENKLKENHQLFKTIFYPKNERFIRESSLLYLDIDELQDLADTIAVNQPFLSRLIENQTLTGFIDMLSEAVKAVEDGEEIELDPIFKQLDKALLANIEHQHFQVSWHNLLAGKDKKDDIYREFITVQPVLDYSKLLPAEDILETIRQWAVESGIHSDNNMRLRLTGGVALSHEELETVSRANIQAIIIAFILVSLVMIFGLGSVKLILAILFSLVIGLIFTAGFATATVGELNLISVVFAVLYIGLGVDFAIHYCLRYRELIIQGSEKTEALANTAIDIGSSLLICAFTTAIGFYAFIPTDYDGVAELGWISGSGMFISLIITLSFLPALLKHLNIQFKTNQTKTNKSVFFTKLFLFPEKNSSALLFTAILLTLFSFWLIQDIKFDNNTLNLQPPDNESVKTFKDLLASNDTSPLTNVVVAKNKEHAEQLAEILSPLPGVKEVLWLDKFIPENQEEKLFIIDEMNLLQGDLFSKTGKESRTLDEKIQSLINFNIILSDSEKTNTVITEKLQESISVFLKQLQNSSPKEKNAAIENLEQSLLKSLQGRLDLLKTSLSTEGLSLDDLGESYVKRWKNNDRYLLEIMPSENLQDNDKLEAFVADTQAVVPDVIGSPVISVEGGKAVVNAFEQAFLSAILAISILLLILMPKKIDVVYVLLPLLLAALLTAAFSVIFSIPLNFANIIALPLLLGIGIDSAIHIIHRYHHKHEEEILLATSSARGILVSALTTILSIGNLAFSPHVGTASMGKLLTLGISMALICSLIFIPSLLVKKYTEK